MNGIRNRIEAIEAALGSIDAASASERSERFAQQLADLTDAELDRLEAITLRSIEVGGPDGSMLAPAECEHVREIIAFVDADEEAYYAAVAETGR